MLPFKKILCPIDFSEPSYEALKVATELAQNFSAELTIVHVVPLVPTVTAMDRTVGTNTAAAQYQQSLEAESKHLLAEAVEKYVPKTLTVRPFIETGDAAHVVAKIAEEEDTDLVVLSTHGRTGWRRFVFGSVAERIVRHTQCPVLTIQAPHIHE
ncbi:MAG: universal stress protein [Calditrichota bacterium]